MLSLALWCPGSFVPVRTIYTLNKRQRQFSEFMLAPGLGRSRYFRLMAIAGVEMLATIPLGTYLIVYESKSPLEHWKSWADSHANYSRVLQVPSLIWKHDPALVHGLELHRWSLVGCAFVFFALFGFADEARLHYRLVYTSLASHIGGFSTFALHGSSRTCVVHVWTVQTCWG
jgi:pheromone a factor receptor